LVKFALSTGRVSFLAHSFRLTTTKLGLRKPETSLYRTVRNAFRYTEPFRSSS